MKLTSTRPRDLFYVDWWLMNHNSWKVSYQHEILHANNIQLPYYKDCERFVDQATAFAAKRNLKTSISFTGGEVTEWPDFDDLLAYCKSQQVKTSFVTNLNLPLPRFQRLLAHTDNLLVEVHPGYTNTSHLLFALYKIKEASISVTVNINMTLELWDDMIALHETLNEKFPELPINKKMLFKDPIFNTAPQDYNQEQAEQLKAQHGDILIESDQGREYTDAQTLILEQRNKFAGYQCWAGIEQVVVDAWGAVHRGHCRKSGFMGYLKDQELYWHPEPLICALPACVNQFDLLATKQSI